MVGVFVLVAVGVMVGVIVLVGVLLANKPETDLGIPEQLEISTRVTINTTVHTTLLAFMDSSPIWLMSLIMDHFPHNASRTIVCIKIKVSHGDTENTEEKQD